MKSASAVLLGSTLAAAAASSLVAAAWATRGIVPVVVEISAVVVWAVAGWCATRLRPDTRIGLLMQVAGLVFALNLPAVLGLDPADPVRSALVLFGRLFAVVQFALMGHVLLAYPTGTLPGRGGRWVVGIAYAYAAVMTPVWIVRLHVTGRVCLGGCPPGPLPPDPHRAIVAVDRAVLLTLAAAVVVLLVRRVRRAGGRERRMLTYPLVAIGVAIGTFVVTLLVDLVSGGFVPTVLHDTLPGLGVAAVPVAFLVGILRDRVGFRAGARLLERIERASPGDLEDALRAALGDPDLRLVFPTVDGGHVDQRGHAVHPESIGGRPHLPVGDDGTGRSLAVIVHDPSLRDEPQLLATLRTAVRFAVDNARLLALNRVHLDEIRASRRRLVAAADHERRRLERDLHDGAQQRLVGIGLAVQMLAAHLPDADPVTKELLGEIDGELHAALDELRNLANGIHPAVLTDHGLDAAVRVLAQGSRLPVAVHGALPHRPSPAVEAAAYFVLSESLVNAVKHASASSVIVRLAHRAGTVTLTVCDDGVGGADPSAGSGLRGLVDRVAAADGRLRLTSPPGDGTRIEVELPCESSSSTTVS